MLTANDITAMLKPTLKRGGDKRAWSISVATTWVPFFTATNVMGKTTLEPDVLGAPLRLAREKDGSIKFSKEGRPMTRVHPVIAEQVKVCRENYEANLLAYAGNVAHEKATAYKAHVALNQRAGEPVVVKMDKDVEDFLAKIAADQAAADQAAAALADAAAQAALQAPTLSENGATPEPASVS